MSYCPNCGRKILEESLGCPYCSVRDNIDYSRSGQERLEGLRREEKAAPQEEKTERSMDFAQEESNAREDFSESRRKAETHTANQTSERFDMPQAASSAQEKKLPLALKIVILVAILMVGFLGEVMGAIAGAVLYKKESEDLHKFGKFLMIFCLVLLFLQLAAVILFGLVSSTVLTHHHVF